LNSPQLMRHHQREILVALAFAALLLLVAVFAPSFFAPTNLRDLLVSNTPVLLVAMGMTLVILTGQIDISVGAQFAVCSVLAGTLAKTGLPRPLLLVAIALLGAMLGALNGVLIAWLRIPSIVVTLAAMVVWRDGLRWITEGSWVQGLPENFQWFGLGQTAGQGGIVLLTAVLFAAFAWALRNVAAGRAVYAVGSDAEAARLAGLNPRTTIFSVFALIGLLTGLAALLNAIRFMDIQSNAGVGLELKAIAAVVVGGTAITGGRGKLLGTLLGVALLGTIGTALTFLGINPFWEKAIQGAIILAAVFSDAVFNQTRIRHAV
jgi:rhamnose transport system permease protein